MRETRRTAVCAISIIGMSVVITIGCWLGSHQEAPTQGGRSLPTPIWQVGDWWIEEVAWVNLPAPRPEWVFDRCKFRVEAVVDVEGYPAYKVSEADIIGEQEQPPRQYLFFRKDDLSLFQVEEPLGLGGKRRLILMQTPGQPAWGEGYDYGWPLFPLREGETKSGFADPPWNFRRADGTIKSLSETGEVQYFRNENYGTQKGEEQPRQEVSVETVEWGGQPRESWYGMDNNGGDQS